jgi:hypothetical protein
MKGYLGNIIECNIIFIVLEWFIANLIYTKKYNVFDFGIFGIKVTALAGSAGWDLQKK